MSSTGGNCSQTGNGERDPDDLAHAWPLAEREDGERDREHRLKRRDHGREPRREANVHCHEQQAELSDTDEQADADNCWPAHVWARHEEDGREGNQSEAEGGKQKGRE